MGEILCQVFIYDIILLSNDKNKLKTTFEVMIKKLDNLKKKLNIEKWNI